MLSNASDDVISRGLERDYIIHPIRLSLSACIEPIKMMDMMNGIHLAMSILSMI